MSKKIVAVLLVATVLFMCVFAACEKNEEDGVYIENDELDLVTDESGNKVLDYDGRLIVYATDEDGERVTNDKGEYETMAQEFQPFEDDGVIEDLGFIIELPEGWKSTSEFGVFENTRAKQRVEISIIKQTYDDYYSSNKEFYEQLKGQVGDDVTWNEELDFGKDFEKICRFTAKTEEGMAIMYFFENSTNLYKVLFSAEDAATAIADSETILNAMSFKPYAYYSDITSKSTTTKAK